MEFETKPFDHFRPLSCLASFASFGLSVGGVKSHSGIDPFSIFSMEFKASTGTEEIFGNFFRWVFPKMWENPQIIHFNRVFHYKPS